MHHVESLYHINNAFERLREKFVSVIELQPYAMFDIEAENDPRRRHGAQSLRLYDHEMDLVNKLIDLGVLVHQLRKDEFILRVFKGGCDICGSRWCDRGEWHGPGCPIGEMILFFYQQAGDDRDKRDSVSNMLDGTFIFKKKLEWMKEYPDKEKALESIGRMKAEIEGVRKVLAERETKHD